jgi:hypothetical protein
MKRKALIGFVLLVVVLIIGAWRVHPYLSETRPSGGPDVVVEGWLPIDLYPAAAARIIQGGYTRIHVTGTERLFAYFLQQDESIQLDLPAASTGELLVNVSGIDGARFLVLADTDTLMDRLVSGTPTDLRTHLPAGKRTLTVKSLHPRELDAGTANLFVKELRINGRNAHGLCRRLRYHRADGRIGGGFPTFAEWGVEQLERAGIPADRLVAVPAWDVQGSRTLANAKAFGTYAQREGITSVDVLSLGVHARRSRGTYQKACGAGVTVGVVSLPDPATPADGWWRSSLGIVRVLKEVFGLPATEVLSATEQE